MIKNLLLKNRVKKPETRVETLLFSLNNKRLYEENKIKENGNIYKFCKCPNCNNEFYNRANIDYRHKNIKVRLVCEICGHEHKETLNCFDYGELIRYITERDYEENYCKNVITEMMNMEDYKEYIYELMNNNKYFKFFREWMRRFSFVSQRNNYHSAAIAMNISMITDNYTFFRWFANNFFYFWD